MDFKQYEEQLLELLEEEDKVSFFCDLLDGLLWNDYKARKELIDYVIEFCEKNALDEALAWMYCYLGWHIYEFSDYKKSIELHKISKDIFMNNDNKKGLVYAYNGLIAVYCQNGQYELANELGISSIAIAREIGDKESIAKLLLNTSITNILAGSYKYAKQILEYIITAHDYDNLSDLYKVVYNKALAEVEINLENFDAAYKALEYAIKNNNKIGVNLFSSELYKLLGRYYGKMKDIDKAEIEFNRSCEIASENNYLFEKCEAMIEWAKFKFDYSDNNKAIELLETVVKISDENKFDRIIKDSSILLYDYYNKIKDYKEALLYLELYLNADKRIQNYNRISYIGNSNSDNLSKEIKLYRIFHDKTEILSSIGQKIISTLDVKKMITEVSNEIQKLVSADFFAITVYDSDTDEMVITIMEEGILNVKPPIKVETSSTFSSYCIKNKKPIVINDIRIEYKKYVNKISFEGRGVNTPISNIYLPLMIQDEILGVMSVQSLKEKAYDTDDVNRLKVIANYIAISLKNAIQYQKIERAAVYDSLTGFLTKREILKEGNSQRARFENLLKSFCILMIDIDDFKSINDTYGHIVGDKALKMITQTIGKLIRATDFIGRYGGDEFLLICPDTTMKTAYKIAQRIRKTVENTRYIINDDLVIKTTLSIGVYEFNDKNLSLSDGINIADTCMYNAKNNNKNKVVAY